MKLYKIKNHTNDNYKDVKFTGREVRDIMNEYLWFEDMEQNYGKITSATNDYALKYLAEITGYELEEVNV